MSDQRGHDHEPDQAALDELLRAFADEPDDADVDVDVDVDEIVIVEQVPMAADEWDQHLEPDDEDEPVPAEPVEDELDEDAPDTDEPVEDEPDADEPDEDEPGSGDVPAPAPSIIRIDDYAGSTGVVPADTEPGEPPPTAPMASPAAGAGQDPLVISIDAEELPDPVYVEGSLDRDGSRTIVFIEDDDTGDTLKPESERDIRRGIEPRMRERRLAIKRAQGRKRLKWFALVLFIVLVIVAGLAVLGSSLFAIQADQVRVTGDVYTDPDRLQEVIDDLVGTPVLLADSQAAERDLEAIPWVDDARVRTDFPHGVTIEIREREAITTYQGPDSRFRVLDREGRVLDVLDGYPLAYLLLGGPDPVDLEPGEFAPRGYAAASELAKNLTGSVRLPNRVEIIEVTADGSRLVMRLNDGTEVRFGEARDLFAKLVRLETVLSSDETRDSTVIDVSTREVTL